MKVRVLLLMVCLVTLLGCKVPANSGTVLIQKNEKELIVFRFPEDGSYHVDRSLIGLSFNDGHMETFSNVPFQIIRNPYK